LPITLPITNSLKIVDMGKLAEIKTKETLSGVADFIAALPMSESVPIVWQSWK
jgi:hypothetical protein